MQVSSETPQGDTEMKDVRQLVSIFDCMPDSKLYDYKLLFEKLKSGLSQFGLTPNQCKVYVFLSKYGSRTAPQVCKALKIHRTETYQLLSTLQNKGIVSASFDHPIRFTAISLETAMLSLVNVEKERLKSLETQKHDLVDLWNKIPDFKMDTNEIRQDEQFQVLKGTNQMAGKVNRMIEGTKESLLILGSEKYFARLYHSDSLAHSHTSKIDIKLLTSCSKDIMYIFEDLSTAKIRKMPDGVEKNLCFIVKDNDELLAFVRNGEQPVQDMMAIWTTSISMVYPMTLLFNYIWSSSKTI